ncbi:hypothetical protein DPM19_23435 [Actinomadura craniellae]|uniref:DUF4244 domain-containing protein n=1 Tax=Actinomadura craniellae TaxID=2231787 RepID=A0A365H1P9_9ACTN|nr:hypothetical protein [Actinomadura craniellae]RAY12959.1 hypothetical protein DPM19_23435 [Actinomadura craniellae]
MQRFRRVSCTALAVSVVCLILRMQEAGEEFRKRSDRGSNVVETIIIVAGFASLAFMIYLAVSGKVRGWINKIPGTVGP